ncbi:MBL fold metallo-hydrolase, partial [Phenylobacterium sp.]|uniref:MBL fold metallo-hydrolase n=1 Tax=Phenylobacterium sp. TaxID=1871053 RepID=UPI0037CC01DA
AGLTVTLVAQHHSHDSYGYRFERNGRAVIYSTDSEHKVDNMDSEAVFEAFFAAADLVICDTMYSLGDTVSLKQDWGHSSNVVAVDLCHAARAKRLALFHHEPTYTDEDIQRMHAESVRYEELVRADRPPLEVICAYDGLEIEV